MMRFIGTVLVNAIAVLLGAYFLDGVSVDNNTKAFIVALVIALLNAFVKPILVFLTIPATIVTLGLFLLVINAGIIIMADYLVDGFHVSSFWYALGFSLILSLITSLFNRAESDLNIAIRPNKINHNEHLG
jgi:putative membrane protein